MNHKEANKLVQRQAINCTQVTMKAGFFVEASPCGRPQGDAPTKNLLLNLISVWQRGDADAILADFAEEADFISPIGAWRGHAAIRQAVESFWGGVHSVEVQVDRVFGNKKQWAVEWRWSEVRRSDGQRHSADDAIIFMVNVQGRITYWREYFDTRNF